MLNVSVDHIADATSWGLKGARVVIGLSTGSNALWSSIISHTNSSSIAICRTASTGIECKAGLDIEASHN